MSIFFKGPGFEFELGKRTYIMGILNITPDSFSDGGKFLNTDSAAAHALEMQVQGADIIDIGAESTRPGHIPVSAEEEISRLVPVLKALKGKLNIPISADTTKPEVAAAAIENGAAIINDVSGFLNESMAETVAKSGVATVIQHPGYEPYPNGVENHVYDFLEQAALKAIQAGIKSESICLDPGIGFGKEYKTNIRLLNNLEKAKVQEYAFLLGVSRKSVIGIAADIKNPAERLAGSIAAQTVAILKGADIIRVHDVAQAVQAARTTDAIFRQRLED